MYLVLCRKIHAVTDHHKGTAVTACGYDREFDENGVLRKMKESRYRKRGQDSFSIREYDENGKLIHKSSD